MPLCCPPIWMAPRRRLSGSQNYQMELASSTTLNLFKFHVNFALPSHSTFSGPTVLTVPAYTDACAATGTCVPEPSPGEQLLYFPWGPADVPPRLS